MSKNIDADDKKTVESVDKGQLSRAGSRGKEAMPNIKVVSQLKKSPTLDIVIDLEETMNPLANSRDSRRASQHQKGSSKPF